MSADDISTLMLVKNFLDICVEKIGKSRKQQNINDGVGIVQKSCYFEHQFLNPSPFNHLKMPDFLLEHHLRTTPKTSQYCLKN
jgi:hypothetical protein